MARIAGASSSLLVLVTLLLLLVARAAAMSLRRQQEQQQSEAAAGGFAYPTFHKARPLTAITPRAASEMLQHALLFELEGGVAGGLLADDAAAEEEEIGTTLPDIPSPPVVGKTEANTTCITEFCLDTAKACFADSSCRRALQCLSDCDAIEDPTPDKIVLQNCTSMCVVTYEDAALDAVNGCFDSHQCITLEPIDLECRDTTEAAAAQPVAEMEGQWWVSYGYNLVYDAFPCQRLTFSAINATTWLYDSEYVAITLDGKERDFEVQAEFPWPQDGTAQSITFTYEYQGMTHGETWKFLHVDPELVLLYYCGNSNTWAYEGALVLSRERTSSEEHLAMATAAFGAIGLAFPEGFVALDNAACEGF